MSDRRGFSRKPRKTLSKQEREELISELVGEEQPPVTEIPLRADPLDAESDREACVQDPDPYEALDALDASLAVTSDEDGADEIDSQDGREDASSVGSSLPETKAETASRHAMAQTGVDTDKTGERKTTTSPDNTPTREKLHSADMTTPKDEPEQQTRDKWDMLDVVPVDPPHLERNLVIAASRSNPAHGAFDVLRTRLVRTLLESGWSRVAITSPSRNCGKTFTAVNLAISLSRYEWSRTILLDLDMRNPSLAEVIGDTRPGKMGDFLRGLVPPEEALVRFDRNDLNIGPGLAIGTNDTVEPYAAELAQDPATGHSLDRMTNDLSPDIVLFDMPPALAFDDVIAFRPHFDGVLMVVGGGETRPDDVREVMRRLGEDVPLLGVVLNQAEGEDGSDYSYGY